jgi:hypothetical protein
VSEADAVKSWLKMHSGDGARFGKQCSEHPCIAEMTWDDTRATLHNETGIARSRQWLFELCRKLGIRTPGRRGPPARVSAEEKRRSSAARWRRWYQRVKLSPEKHREYLDKDRERRRRKRDGLSS